MTQQTVNGLHVIHKFRDSRITSLTIFCTSNSYRQVGYLLYGDSLNEVEGTCWWCFLKIVQPNTLLCGCAAVAESEQEAILAARIADAHLSVGRAASRVAQSEEQAASLERDALEAARKALQVAKEARETERRLADAALAEERKRHEEQERAEQEELQRKMAEEEAALRQAEEERKRKAEMSKKNLSPEDEEAQRKRNEMNNPSKWPLFTWVWIQGFVNSGGKRLYDRAMGLLTIL